MPNTFSVISTKLHRPPITDDLVVRKALFKKLEQNRHKKITLISAPTGYGKSVLASQWLETLNTIDIWISLDEDHNNLRTFLEYLAAGIEKEFHTLPENIINLLDATELPPIKEIVQRFLQIFESIQQNIVMVLDDYYFIKNPKIHELLKHLLRFLPQNIHMLILTRRDPPFGVAALRANNMMFEIGISDLSFTKQDIIKLNKKLLNVNLSDEATEKLWDKTEGWIVGLRMALLMVSDTNKAENIYNNFSGSMHYVSDFLFSEVVSKQPKQFQELLIKASLFNRFSGDMLNEVVLLENGDPLEAHEFVSWLIKAKLFIIPLDNEMKWVRYHHLFQDMLKKEAINKLNTKELQVYYNNASKWFEKQGLIKEAIDYAIVAKNYAGVFTIIEKSWLSAFNQDLWYDVENWIARIPKEVTDESTLLLFIRAWILNSKHQLSKLPPILERISTLKTKLSDTEEGYLAFFQCMFTYYSGNIQQAYQLAEKALKLIPTDQIRFRADIGSWCVLSLQALDKGDQALTKIGYNLEMASIEENSVLASRLRAQYVLFYLVNANLFKIKSATKEFLKINDLRGLALGFGGYFDGCTYWWGNDYKGVVKYIEPALKYRYQTVNRVPVDAYIAKAMALQKLNKTIEANKTIEQMLEFVGNSSDTDIYLVAKSAQARLALLQGRLADAQEWLLSTEQGALFPTEWWWIESPPVTRCRVLLALEKPSYLNEAISLLENYQNSAETWHNNLRNIELLVLQCIAYKKAGKKGLALNKLKSALELASKGMWTQPFVESESLISSFLTALKTKKIQEDFITVIQEEIKKEKVLNLRIKKMEQKSINSDQVPSTLLSKREYEVLELISKGLSNKEISSHVFVSESTIKSHIYNIFKKLDVKSRIELINKAQETDIL